MDDAQAAQAIADAFDAARRDFEAMCAPDHEPTSAVEAAQIALVARYDRGATRHADLVDAMHLIGAVGAVLSADQFPDRVGAMMTAMGLVTVVAASWRLAVEPILSTSLALVPTAPPSVADSILARELLHGVPDLALAATFEAKPTESMEERDARRRQMFNALGMIMTGLVLFARLTRITDTDDAVVDLYLQAVESAWT